MATLADELLNDFEASGSEDEASPQRDLNGDLDDLRGTFADGSESAEEEDEDEEQTLAVRLDHQNSTKVQPIYRARPVYSRNFSQYYRRSRISRTYPKRQMRVRSRKIRNISS